MIRATAAPETQSLEVGPGPNDRSVKLADGQVLSVPVTWALLPPGDAGITRRVKAAGPSWTVKQRRGRREFSLGVWADARIIERETRAMNETRSTPQYAKQMATAKKRRDDQQEAYVEDFHGAVVAFLNFHVDYQFIAQRVAAAVTTHATPVGSGTVARTQRIPVQERAEAAVIAWMRHQTTAYDEMKIARVRGLRREVRRELAARSRQILKKYRVGDPDALKNCPLATAMRNATSPPAS